MAVPESQTTEKQPVGTVSTHAVHIVVAAVVISLLPFLVAIVVWSFRSWTPLGDLAIIDLRVRDMFGPNTTLTGAYSRYGWNHPGPFELWTVALMGLPFGRPAWATLVGHVVLQIVPISLVMWWASRRSRRALLAAALFVVVCYSAHGPWMIIEPWNPHVAFAWWICLLVTAALVIVGERRLLAPLLIAAAIVLQLHVGYLPIAVPIVALVLWWTWRDSAPARSTLEWDRRRWRRSFGAGVGVAVLISLPILINQLRGDPGNLTLIWRFFSEPAGSVTGSRSALAIIGEGFALPPQWVGRPTGFDPISQVMEPRSVWWVLVAVVLLALGWVAARGLPGWATRMMTLVTTCLFCGAIAISRITGDAAEYLYYWRTPLSVFTWATVAGVVAARLRVDGHLARWWPVTHGRRQLLGVGVVVVIALRVLPLAWDVAESPPEVSTTEGMEQLIRSFVDRTSPRAIRNGPIWVRPVGGNTYESLSGVINGLDRAGADVRTGPGTDVRYGSRRAAVGDVGEVWYVGQGGPWVTALIDEPGARVLVANTPLSRSDEERLRTLHRELGAQLTAAGRGGEFDKLNSDLAHLAFADVPGMDPAALEELARLNHKLASEPCRCAIVAFDVEDDPDIDLGAPLFAGP